MRALIDDSTCGHTSEPQLIKGGFDDLFAIFHHYSQGKRSDFDHIFWHMGGEHQPWIFFARKEPAMEIYFT